MAESARVGVNFDPSLQEILNSIEPELVDYILYVHSVINLDSIQRVNLVRGYTTVDPNDSIVAEWPSVYPKVREVIASLPWATVSVVTACYLSHDETVVPKHRNPVVLIGAPKESQASWQDMAAKIYSLCQLNGLKHVRVLFEASEYPLSATGPSLSPAVDQYPVAIEENQLAETIPMGSSFGPIDTGTQRSASMGGTIKLQRNGEKPVESLLSVLHAFDGVVSPEALSNGLRHDPEQPILLKMPSLQDIEHSIRVYQRRMREQRAAADFAQAQFEKTREGNDQRYALSITKGLRKQQETLKQLQRIQNSDSGQGTLQYGSRSGTGLDWSLSSFKDRKIDNIPPTREEVETHLEELGYWPDAWSSGQDVPEVVKYSCPEVNSLVVKRGRRTGLTIGRVNAILTTVVTSDTQGKVEIKAHPVLSDPRENGGVEKAGVGMGDSGAWYLNADGEWVGSIVAAHIPASGDSKASFAIMMEAEKIVEDIEQVTGMKVVSPARPAASGENE